MTVKYIISRTVLKIEICEKYKRSGMLLIFRIKIFENTSILLINAAWIGKKCILKRQPQTTKLICQNTTMRVYEHGLKNIAFYVQKHIVHQAVCYNFPLVRDKPPGAPAFVRFVY